MSTTIGDLTAEWLEADGLGGFASGTVGGFRTRRYHALLLTARRPPTDRIVLVNGFEAWIESKSGPQALSTQHYAPDVYYPNGRQRLQSFHTDPWPTWNWQFEDGMRVEFELFVAHKKSLTALSWRILDTNHEVKLCVRPLISGRDYHALHRENPDFRFDCKVSGQSVSLQPYAGLPQIVFASDGQFEAVPNWYRDFLYSVERDRGLDCQEDLASPGIFSWQLTDNQRAIWLLAAEGSETEIVTAQTSLQTVYEDLRDSERARRRAFATPLHRAADAYIVQRGSGKTIVAGYPWFTDWGRDTFISLRGLCLATGRLEEADQMLATWADTVSEGMLPNRFPDHGETPEFNSVDASLWYVVAVYEFLMACEAVPYASRNTDKLISAVVQILEGYSRGTRFGIRCDDDGLLAAGVPGMQLTWMDAKVGDWVVTPRIGKPVEIQALWLNALALARRFDRSLDRPWRQIFERGLKTFQQRFWNPENGGLFDLVDVDHVPHTADASIRPNQIFAVGGLPISLFEGEKARHIVDLVEAQLLTPLGLRTLSPHDPAYRGYYQGGVRDRDGAYHQGTVWPWLLGPFVDAWVRVRGRTSETVAAARERFLPPLYAHLNTAGLGHISEVADGDAPFTPGGCPFQAWSLAELLRLERQVLR